MSTLQRESNSIEVRFDDDLLKAYIKLIPIDMRNLFTKEQILEELAAKNVIYGIKIDVIETIVDKQLVYTEVVVAEGDAPVDGQDGNYQYFFNIERDSKPIILADGSADYSSLSKIEKVSAGQIIARYNKAIKGTNGKNIKGQQMLARIGRELLPLSGKGFSVNEDKTVYTANIDGKIEMRNDKIEISDVLVIEGDVDSTTGDADFIGDITVRGNVMTGAKVKAGGNINVIGHVEAADLIAGGAIVLQNGMQGGGKGTILAGGDVSGKFFEQVTIQAKGSVNANAIMHCRIDSQGEVNVSGKRGVIVGGVINAATGVTATIIGSMAEVQTEVNIGYQSDPVPEIIKRENEIKTLVEEIRKIDEAIKTVIAYIERDKRDDLLQNKIQLLKTKIDRNSQISIITKQRNELLEDLERAKDAKVIVTKVIYPRVRIKINGSTLVIKEEFSHVLIKRKGIDVCLFAME
ncbi:FapA family protein [Anaerosporobacter sp.]|uniref:FapA family protein n=1 Tax=Anaerosporobacter sp. TaxID=1872529 RepID=UPI00286EBD88|nr:FapA family protein [Anaerosporobacter sp.]